MTESVIDFPQKTLCPEIWDKVMDKNGIQEIWCLKPVIISGLDLIIQKIMELVKLDYSKMDVHIIGSITSNSYTENADIDLHFQFVEGYAIREFAEHTQDRFKRAAQSLKATNPDAFMIGKHPIEIYYQPNKFQDFMSVGCYDFKNKKWLVGPELSDQSFNPYSEYYKEIYIKSENTAEKIRNMIFSIYEIAIVYKKNLNTSFAANVRPLLIDRLSHVDKLYEYLRNTRKFYSEPKSKEEALINRSSRKWKIADASFKLFNKYGYTAILKQYIEIFKLMSASNDLDEEATDSILQCVKHYINNADKLSETEIFDK